MEEGWATLVDAEVLAQQLGLLMSEAGGTLTLRGDNGILTLFPDSSVALWQPRGENSSREESLSAAVRHRDDGWWLPVDVLSYLGLWLHDGIAEGPDNLVLRLRFPPAAPVSGQGAELVDLGTGVPGLRLFAAGRAGPATQSMLLADAGLLGLAVPEQRNSFDELVAASGDDHPLLVFVTAAASSEWEMRIEFSQGQMSLEVKYPFRLRLLEGQPARVAPDAPVVGVVLLPQGFDLRRPIDVRWGGASATVTFRR